jgi:hypothetical protein
MKKMKLILTILLVTFAVACGQDDKTFTVPIKAYAGIQFTSGGPIQFSPFTGGGGNMVYPGVGIPLSTGSAWGVSITNNSANWNTAFSWGNHAGLYRPIAWVPTFAQVTSKPTTLAGYGITDAKPLSYVPTYAEITGKPTLFDGTWTSLTGKPSLFSGSYLDLTNKPLLFSGSYTDLTNTPQSIELADAILSLQGIKLPVLTTVQINALTPVVGLLVYDSTLNVLKIYTGTWKTIITGN